LHLYSAFIQTVSNDYFLDGDSVKETAWCVSGCIIVGLTSSPPPDPPRAPKHANPGTQLVLEGEQGRLQEEVPRPGQHEVDGHGERQLQGAPSPGEGMKRGQEVLCTKYKEIGMRRHAGQNNIDIGELFLCLSGLQADFPQQGVSFLVLSRK